jgi:hypothetical protein
VFPCGMNPSPLPLCRHGGHDNRREEPLWSAKNISACQAAGCESTLDDNPPSCDNSRRRHPLLEGGITAMTKFPRWIRYLRQLAGM